MEVDAYSYPCTGLICPKNPLSEAIFRKELKKYTKVNVTAYYDIMKNIEVFSRIENLTDAEYEDVLGFGTPGRSFYLGFRFNY